MPKPRSPYDVTLTPDQRQTLGIWLAEEIQAAIDARASAELEVDYWHRLYEQDRTRAIKNLPWPDAADLTSYLASEKVDALHARIMRTIFTEPVWTVEGWGDSADRAPLVEEFHQWKVEEERLQTILDKWVQIALIEPRGLLEVYEDTTRQTRRVEQLAQVETDPATGGWHFDEDGAPQLRRDAQGLLLNAQPDQPAAQVSLDETDVIRRGPQYRVIPYRDSVILPGHARDRQDVWGYGKRFWRRATLLKTQAKDGYYDWESVEAITDTSDREADLAMQRSGLAVADTRRLTAEKELWEVLMAVDLEQFAEQFGLTPIRGQGGDRWYVATVHLKSPRLLRFQHEDLGRARYIPLIPFPRTDRVTEGFSFVGHKLITVAEEHTAFRNMAADRSALAVGAPIMKLVGALWDEHEQPFGPKAVITVRDPREIQPMVIPDVPPSIFQHLQNAERTAERVAGINDVASGQVAQESRTLGEVQMATEQSFVRMDLIVHRIHEALEELAQIRHAIWERTLAEQPDGMEAPASFTTGLQLQGLNPQQTMPTGKITAAMLRGRFRFKPHGSVETADLNRLRNDTVGLLSMLPKLVQVFPSLGPMFQTPQAARAMARELFRVFRFTNAQAFLGSPSADGLTPLPVPPPPPAPMPRPPGLPAPGANGGMPPLPTQPPVGIPLRSGVGASIFG